jgi:hypothetical protein
MIRGQTGRGTGPRPHTWVTGPDELTHAQYRAFIQCRAQANWSLINIKQPGVINGASVAAVETMCA